jgi:hypothetical protein
VKEAARWKALTIVLLAGLLAGTALTAAAQMTTGYPGLGGSAADSGAGSGGPPDSANGAEPEKHGTTARQPTPEPANRLGPGGASLVPGGNGVLGTGDVPVGNWAGTNPGVNRNLSGYTYGPPNAFGSPSVTRGPGPPPGVSR